MQHIRVVSGKLSNEYSTLVFDIEKRLGSFCKYETFNVKETARAEDYLSKGVGMLVALDDKGVQMTSESFAQFLKQHEKITFFIGTSEGFPLGVIEKSALKLSLGTMTLPHMLTRLVLCEQIYRGFTILAGKKYHK